MSTNQSTYFCQIVGDTKTTYFRYKHVLHYGSTYLTKLNLKWWSQIMLSQINRFWLNQPYFHNLFCHTCVLPYGSTYFLNSMLSQINIFCCHKSTYFCQISFFFRNQNMLSIYFLRLNENPVGLLCRLNSRRASELWTVVRRLYQRIYNTVGKRGRY